MKRTIGASSTASERSGSLLGVVVAGRDLEAVHLEVVAAEFRHRRVDLLERHASSSLLSLSSSTTTASIEKPVANLISSSACRLVGIGDRDEQLLAALDQRQHAVLAQHLFADDADGVEVGLDRVQVQQRRAELLRGGDGDLARIGHVVLDQVGDDADPALLGGGDGVDHQRCRPPGRPRPGAAAGPGGPDRLSVWVEVAKSFMGLALPLRVPGGRLDA